VGRKTQEADNRGSDNKERGDAQANGGPVRLENPTPQKKKSQRQRKRRTQANGLTGAINRVEE
jgi:hypothetical protein